ncbi:MAG TPA: PDZ domain-containing protein [Dongiaceae bacterium]|nr:PDZ domain-containing protein [Dongiaceae bacterium]
MNHVCFAVSARASMVVALLVLGRAAEAKSTIEFCNSGNTALSIVTIGDHPKGGWVMGGWRTIQPSDCATVDTIFQLNVGVAITTAGGERGMQVYDPGISRAIFAPTASSYCVPATGDFWRRGETMLQFSECQAGDVLARFAFHLKCLPGEDTTIQIPADKDGEIIPFQQPRTATHSFPPFQPSNRLLPPDASFELALRGLAEQQERLRLRIERLDLTAVAYWRAFYFRELGIVARPESHATAVAKGSPADKAGLRRGDEILLIDDISLQSAWHARSLLTRTRPGESHSITFLRDAQLRQLDIVLTALPAQLAATELHPKQGWLGIEFESTVRVAAVVYQDGTPHLELGDDIIKIGRSDFDGVDGLARWLARDTDAKTAELQVRRKSTGQIVVMTLDKLK